MAPAPDSEGRIQTYLTVFKHANLDVDWKAFAAELGISSTGSAQRKFKDALKKDGHQYASGKVTPLLGTESPKVISAPSKRKKKEAAVAAESNETPSKKQKRKSDEDDDNDDRDQI